VTGHAPFRKIPKGHLRIVPGNIHIKFEVHSFNRFGEVLLRSTELRSTHRRTWNGNTIPAIHVVHLVEITMWYNMWCMVVDTEQLSLWMWWKA